MLQKYFKVHKQYNFALSQNFIDDHYRLVIGTESVNFYKALYSASLGKQYSRKLCTFLTANEIDSDAFKTIREKLEGINLLRTFIYQKEGTNDLVYQFIVIPPLSYGAFIKNEAFRELLLKKASSDDIERFEYDYSINDEIPDGAVEVTTKFEKAFSNIEGMQSALKANVTRICNNIVKACEGYILSIDTESKSVIEEFYRCYDLSTKEITRCVKESIIEIAPNSFAVDPEIIRIKLQQLVNSDDNSSIVINARLNRNTKIFTMRSNVNDEVTQKVFKDYINLNTEQYLRSLTSEKLDEVQIAAIKKFREKFFISDPIINFMLDYTYFKTQKINIKYLEKFAASINALGIRTLSEAYDYIIFQTSTQNNKTENVLED
jgi:replication initiation and membrane attachment protein DnaB